MLSPARKVWVCQIQRPVWACPKRVAAYTRCVANTITEIPRRINATNIFNSKGDDFENPGLILASFPPDALN
jgi:hypothetical protein